jgi:hypothetical protein
MTSGAAPAKFQIAEFLMVADAEWHVAQDG